MPPRGQGPPAGTAQPSGGAPGAGGVVLPEGALLHFPARQYLEAIGTPKVISGCIVPFVVEAAKLISERASRVSMHTRTQTALPASLNSFKVNALSALHALCSHS